MGFLGNFHYLWKSSHNSAYVAPNGTKSIKMKGTKPSQNSGSQCTDDQSNKVRKTKTGPLQGNIAWSRDPKSAFF